MTELAKTDSLLAKVVCGKDLSVSESEELFGNILLHDRSGFRFTALMSAIHAKGETDDELCGLINFYKKNVVRLSIKSPAQKTTDVSGTGGGSFKTINVSTASSFIVASVGYTVAKASYFGITSAVGSADLFGAFDIDITKLTKDVIEKTLDSLGICPYYTFSLSPKLRNRSRLFKKVYKDSGIKIPTPGHLTTNAFSPLQMLYRIYGCYSENYLNVLANLFMKLGFKKTLIFFAEIGMPEISNVGKTNIVEQDGNKITKYVVHPFDLGVEEAKESDIKSGGKHQNIKDFIRILKGQEKGPKSDLVAVNAGASLYSLGDVKDLNSGTKKAKQILSSGAGYEKLEKLIKEIGNIKTLNKINHLI